MHLRHIFNDKARPMNYYTLQDKTMDQDFLAGKVIHCSAVVPLNELKSPSIQEGEKIVIILSNGKKYSGKVLHFNHTVVHNFAQGYLEIQKY